METVKELCAGNRIQVTCSGKEETAKPARNFKVMAEMILDVTEDITVDIGNLPWITVRRVITEHIEAARKELITQAAFERRILQSRLTAELRGS